MLILDGLIREVGPTRRVENLAVARSAIEINASGRVVMPGFVDCQTHLLAGGPRLLDYEMALAGADPAEIAKAGGGSQAVFRETQSMSPAALEAQGVALLKDFTRHGVTTIEANSGCGITEAAEIKILRVLHTIEERPVSVVPVFLAPRFIPDGYRDSGDLLIEWLCSRMLPVLQRRKLVQFVSITCEDGVFSGEQTRQFLLRAAELGFWLKMSAGERICPGSLAMAVSVGAVSIEHIGRLDAVSASALAASATVATLLPGPVFHGKQGIWPLARDMIDRGVAVALGTGFDPQTSPTLNMQMILSLACREMEMTPAESISAATVNAACAIRRENAVGSIEFGKWADILILSVPDYREIPYHFGVNQVETVLKRGQIVYQRSEVVCPASGVQA